MESELAKLLPFPFQYLDDELLNYQNIIVDWKQYYVLGLITADQMTVLEEMADKTRWTEFLLKDSKFYISALFNALENLSDRKPVLIILQCLEELSIQYTKNITSTIEEYPQIVKPLMFLLGSPDDFVSLEAARAVCILKKLSSICLCDTNLLSWVIENIMYHGEKEYRCLAATFFLQFLLQLSDFRRIYFEHHNAVNALIDLLSTSRNVQLQYQALFCIWIITFDETLIQSLQLKFGIIPILLDLAKAAVKEKLIRVCLACWKNFLVKSKAMAIPVMIGSKILEFIEHLSLRKITDSEMLGDLVFVKEELTRAYQTLNSFDEYASEIKSGKLNWSPPHKSTLFWQDNAYKLEENDLELLKILTKLLAQSRDPTVLSIAAYDLGEYVKNRPMGRIHFEVLGTKQQLMHLMAHQNSDVRFNALNSVQKYMSNLWY